MDEIRTNSGGNGTVISYKCKSAEEALDMVAALYNGRAK